jgi:Family of unknown function (DUF6370)
MRYSISAAIAFFAVAAFVCALSAADDKEVTLKGTICCGKCELKETKACSNAIKVKENDKEVVYFFKDKANKESYHKCSGTADGSVKGTVSEKDGKKYITPAKDGVKID